MSRCFPYHAPGYALSTSRASNGGLIDSIKLLKERGIAKAERKKEMGEKEKSKKEKAKPNAIEYDYCGGEEFWGNSEYVILQKERKDDPQQLERSSVTEEQNLAQNPSYSSGSTQNSHKRKRDTSRRLHTSQQIPVHSQEDMRGSGLGSKKFKKMQRMVQKYTVLIENWSPSSQQLQCSDADDQDWLFVKKKLHPNKTNGVDNQISCSTSASSWASAQYLPGADIYALPFIVPI